MGEWTHQFQEAMMMYNCAIREVKTRLEVLNDELSVRNKRNPIELIKSRVKRPISIIEKLHGLGYIVDGHSRPSPEFSRFRHRVRTHPAGLRGYVPRLASPPRGRGKIVGGRDSSHQMACSLLYPLHDGVRQKGRAAESLRLRHDGSGGREEKRTALYLKMFHVKQKNECSNVSRETFFYSDDYTRI